MIGLSEFWCPGEDSVTQARPRSGLHARPFSSSRQVLKHLTFWAGMKKADHLAMIGFLGILVPRRGLEPPHPKAHGPEPCASTNSATWALTAEFVFQPTPARQKVTIARFLNDANYFCIFSYPTEINAALALHKNRFYAYCYIKSWGNPCQPVYPHKVDSRYGHLAINGIIKTRTRCQRVFLCLAPTGQRVF